MKTFDWIIVGGGLAGSALSYELAKVGFSVLLLEDSPVPSNGTRYSYGGIAYWSGSTDLTKQLCQEGIAIHHHLSSELGADTQFREMNLLLMIDADRDPEAIVRQYQQFPITPALLTPDAAVEAEPLLNPEAIAAALLLPHGHVSPEATVKAYNQAFLRAGGTMQVAPVTGLIQMGDRVQGVTTPTQTYEGANVAICAGGLSRSLLNNVGISTRLYFTQAEIIETLPVEVQLQTIVMPAELKRFEMEATAGSIEHDALWDQPGHEVVAPVLDIGAIQFQDGSLRIGQVSRTLTDPQAQADAAASECELRQTVGHFLPALKQLPGQWSSCLVSFSGDRLPLVGQLAAVEGLYLFSGFSNPFAVLPPVARRFAQSAMGQPDEPDILLAQLSPNRLIP
ncbi:MAG: FAD-binding oxidoreductase [Drouetiella hepatica Uher 2000/2452]|jgi:glycine/D-amino acid oxidase-like deaminating enzyme|uniref:FAD-binding oxidoreductase n=1 Tax=Drouetiella hepatica Uher 2000/2452 TaxID=904376 RepID=A0A951Q9W6_9CYAN|nr:FAD-binding oxidoreductase [Drouetiella hepatica Uher 2000/2452]